MITKKSVHLDPSSEYTHIGLLVCDKEKKTIEIADSSIELYDENFRQTLLDYGDRINEAIYGRSANTEHCITDVMQATTKDDCGPLFLLSCETACQGEMMSSTRINISDLRLGQSYALENRKTSHWQVYRSPMKPADNPNAEPLDPEMIQNVKRNLQAEL